MSSGLSLISNCRFAIAMEMVIGDGDEDGDGDGDRDAGDAGRWVMMTAKG